MATFTRAEPFYSLCGLHCCLCPRFHTDGVSRCPGCGGPGFSETHPTCAVATCNARHDAVEFCFQCSAYPCERYAAPSPVDSFVSYLGVLDNFAAAKRDLPTYLCGLRKRHAYLLDLIANYNDGRSKGLYCVAMNNLPLDAIEDCMDRVKADRELTTMDPKARAGWVAAILREAGERLGIPLALRKEGVRK